MSDPTTYASFMIRLWRAPSGQGTERPEPDWLGEIESVQTGRIVQFKGLEALTSLLTAQLPDYTDHRE